MLGTYALSAGYYDAFYGKAQKVRTLIIRDFERRLRGLRRAAVAHVALHGLPLRRQGRPAHHVPERRLHHPVEPGRAPGHLGAVRRRRRRAAGGGAGARPGMLGEPTMFRAAAVLERGPPTAPSAAHHRPRRASPARGLGDGDRPRGPLRAGHRHEAVLPARNEFGDEPNTNVCPVCLGLPGSLPVLNERAVEYAMRLGLALNCRSSARVFARKNYFYPDMPKDYQISQYDQPINVDGWLELPSGKRVGIERAHIEEDTGKSTHVGGSGRIHDAGYSLVDYNRAGVPLIEIVSRPGPPHRGPGQGLRRGAAGHPPGHRRVRRQDGGGLAAGRRQRVGPARGRRRAGHPLRDQEPQLAALAGRAIEYEARRQSTCYESGDRVRQETRHWDEAAAAPGTAAVQGGGRGLPLLPRARPGALEPVRRVGRADPGRSAGRCRPSAPPPGRRRRRRTPTAAIAVQRDLDALALAAIAAGADPAGCSPTSSTTWPSRARPSLDPAALRRAGALETAGELTATQAKQVLAEMVATGATRPPSPPARGFEAMDSGALAAVRRRHHRRQPRRVGAVPHRRRQGPGQEAHRLLRRQGHEGHQGKADGKAVTALRPRRWR
jgi:aspartyl-tRNA(Asn)/glutamyl-tRNA(Gln) amidotransferase subunit B